MGGKHKQAQRIKNNARPSSSGRSAELLASSSSPHFGIGREIRFVPPTLSLLKTDEFDSSVSSDFQIVFKKMNKKDSTTKLKALQEFSELITNSDVDAVKSILSFWATLFNILATDTDHRIREAVHNAHYHIILKDKKIIAPFLKQLIGPWFTSQYDTYPPAATAAIKSFSAVFPANKVQDCVVFCQKEILMYIYQNLTSKVETNPKHGTNEDAEAKFERIIISSLQGYCLYLSTVTEEHIKKCQDLNRDIITNSRFLKLSSCKVSAICAAFFKVLATLYDKATFLLDGQHQFIVPVIFNNLDESEPSVVGPVWEAALLLMNLEEEWWKFINLEKNYFQKLRKVLREGGHGNAAVIYPNLLSFIHKLPPVARLDQFYDSFFDNLRLGLKKKSVNSSKAESSAILTSFLECLQYITLNNAKDVQLCEKMIKSHLIPFIEWNLLQNQISHRIASSKTASLVQYWARNKNLENYETFLKIFWDGVNVLFLNISSNFEENTELGERQISFLQNLSNVAKPRNLKVKFATEGDKESRKKVEQTDDESYNRNLRQLAFTTLQSYVDFIEKKRSKDLQQYIFSVIQMFESEDFLRDLSRYLSKDERGDLVEIYNKTLYQWLKSEDLRSEIVVFLTFVLFKYLSEEEKVVVLETFLQFCGTECFEWCVKTALSHPHCDNPLVQTWLKNQKISEFLVQTTEKNLQSDCPTNLKTLFQLAFREIADGELMIAMETVTSIIEKLRKPLDNPADFSLTIDSCARLASFVSEIIYTEDNAVKFGDDLLLSLFKFTVDCVEIYELLTDDTLWEVNTSWQDAISTLSKRLPKNEFLSLTEKFGAIVEHGFKENCDKTEHFSKIVVDYLRATFNGQPLMMTQIFDKFFNRSLQLLRSDVENVCNCAEYLNGSLCSPWDIKKFTESQNEDNIFKYFVWSYLKSSVLQSTIEESEDGEEVKEIIFTVDSPLFLTELLYDTAAAKSYLERYKMAKHFGKIAHYYTLTKNNIKVMLDKLEALKEVQQVLAEKLKENSWLWCKAVSVLTNDIAAIPPQLIYDQLKSCVSKLSVLHLTELLASDLNFDCVAFMGGVAEDCVVLRSQLHCEEIDVQIAGVFDGIKKLRGMNNPKFLFEDNDITWTEAEEIIETIRLFSSLVNEKFECLTRQHWDFGVISLTSWAANCYKQRNKFENQQIQALFMAVCDFFINVDKKMTEIEQNDPKNDYLDEWENLFLPNLLPDLLRLWLYLSDQLVAKKTFPITLQPFIQKIGRVVDHFDHKFIFKQSDTSLPSWSKILKKSCTLLVHSEPALQLWGYKMLMVLVPGLVEIDLQSANSSTPNVRGYTCEHFKEVLLQTHTIVNDILAAFKLGEDSCQIEPFTDSYTYGFAYLLMWNVLFTMCEKSPPELRYQYADWLRNQNFFKSLLNNLFKLIPAEILNYNEGKAKGYLKLFQDQPDLDFQEPSTSEHLEQLACWVYAFSLSQLPALVRQWWSETDSKVAQIIEKVTAFYVSPQLCNQELLDVAHNETKFKNMTIRVIPSVREVVAIYTVDEAQMELVITLPQNYPLGGPDVRCNRQIGGALHKQWLMQLKKCLLHQNGRVWDGLSLWNANLDKKFDGVEECYICFAVLHPGTYQLPKLSCQTCRKKFHSACLYKWFSTSNKSSCPICRNLF